MNFHLEILFLDFAPKISFCFGLESKHQSMLFKTITPLLLYWTDSENLIFSFYFPALLDVEELARFGSLFSGFYLTEILSKVSFQLSIKLGLIGRES